MKVTAEVKYIKCNACHGTGIDPESKKSWQEDEYDCIECSGYGDYPEYDL